MVSKMTQKRDELEFAKSVGVSFVKQFYTSMATEGLESLEKFYGEDSMFSFNGEVVSQGTGVAAAYGKIGFKDALFDLESGTFDFAPSHDEGLIIIVNGFVVLAGNRAAFTQTFFLAPQRVDGVASSYFVLNDILRLSDEGIKGSASGEVQVAEEKEPVREVEAVKDAAKETVQEVPASKDKKAPTKKPSRPEKKEQAAASVPAVPPLNASNNTAKPNVNNNNNRKRTSKPPRRDKLEKKEDNTTKLENKTEEKAREKSAEKEKEKVSSWASIVSKNEEPEEVVQKEKEKGQRSRPNSRNSFQKYPNCLFVKEIEKDVTQQQLGELFETYGKVKTVEIIRDRKYAFVTFENPEGVKSALSADKIMLKEKSLVVQERTSQTSGRSFGRGGRFRNRKTNGKQNGLAAGNPNAPESNLGASTSSNSNNTATGKNSAE